MIVPHGVINPPPGVSHCQLTSTQSQVCAGNGTGQVYVQQEVSVFWYMPPPCGTPAQSLVQSLQ